MAKGKDKKSKPVDVLASPVGESSVNIRQAQNGFVVSRYISGKGEVTRVEKSQSGAVRAAKELLDMKGEK